MKIFLDANILVSVLNKEYPLFTYSSRLLSLSDKRKFRLYTSPLCLAIAFYSSVKKSGKRTAKRKIEILTKNVSVTTMNASTVSDMLSNKAFGDFEHGLQIYSAMESGCTCIVTEDKNDFRSSSLEVLGAEAFLMKYIWS